VLYFLSARALSRILPLPLTVCFFLADSNPLLWALCPFRMLSTGRAMCYNRRAVERAAKQELAQVLGEPAQGAARPAAPSQGGSSFTTSAENASRYCPVCSQRLESRRCKLICSVCGYYMSCSDFY
jgi:hypothetical protein